jgi:hypothetical protein
MQSQSNYFPLEVGNYWQFRTTHIESFDTTISYTYIQVLSDTSIGQPTQTFKRVKFLTLPPYYPDIVQFFRYDSTTNSVLDYSADYDSTAILFDFSALPSDCWWAWNAEICHLGSDTTDIFGFNKLSRHYLGGSIPSFTVTLTEDFGPTFVIDNQSYVISSIFIYDLIYAKINGAEFGQVVSVEEDILKQPTSFRLYQNYPNPFNPITIIKYQTPRSGLVSMKVYDLLGKEISTLVNEEKSVGEYKVQFNAEGLASGIYFYMLRIEDYTSYKRMTLIK